MSANTKKRLETPKYAKEAIIIGGMDSMIHAPRMVLSNETDGITRTIVLPMPKSLIDNTSIEWDSQAAGVATLAEDLTSLQSAGGSAKDIFDNVDLTKEGIRNLISMFGAVLGGEAKVVSDLIRKRDKKIVNPFQEQFFRGVGLRSFTFDWEIVPLAEEEQIALSKAIKALKRGSLPTLTDKIYMSYPEPWTVNFYADGMSTAITDEHLPVIGSSHISAINVDYQAAGHTAYHKDNAPVQTNLSIALTEANIVYGDEYDGD